MGPAAMNWRAPATSANHIAVPNGRPLDPPSLTPPAVPRTAPPTPPAPPPPPVPAPPSATPPREHRPPRPSSPVSVPCYSTFALNAASKGEYPVDESTGVGIILLRCSALSHPATALWDTGAEGNFASWHFVERHGLQSQMQPSNQRVKYADGSVREARGELTLPLKLLTHGRGYECKLRVIVADLQPRFDLVLGTPFCKAHKPRPDW